MPELSRRGLTVAAISGIDIALWDILGKSLGVPVWRLLGGRRPTSMPAYASGGWADADTIGEQLQSYIDAGGFKAVKMRVGAMDGAARVSAERVKAARAALGPDIDIMVDSHGTFTVGRGQALRPSGARLRSRLVRRAGDGDDKAGIAEVRAATSIPIAAGESEFTRFDFRDLIIGRCRRHPAARSRDLRRHHRRPAYRRAGLDLQSPARAASMGGRTGLLRRPASLRREPCRASSSNTRSAPIRCCTTSSRRRSASKTA